MIIAQVIVFNARAGTGDDPNARPNCAGAAASTVIFHRAILDPAAACNRNAIAGVVIRTRTHHLGTDIDADAGAGGHKAVRRRGAVNHATALPRLDADAITSCGHAVEHLTTVNRQDPDAAAINPAFADETG